MNTDELSILVCTCDKYHDALPPLFQQLEKYWPQFKDYEVYLNTESKKFDYPGLVINHLLLPTERIQATTWSERLLLALKQIKKEYVLIDLDDYYLEAPVDQDVFLKCCNFLSTHPNAASICVWCVPGPFEKVRDAPFLLKRSHRSKYLVNLQMTIWRKSVLEKLIRTYETPWDFERMGSIRGMLSRYSFYVTDERLFNYNASWYGLSQGKWLPKTREFFEKEGISNVDLSTRGFFELGHWTPYPWRKTIWNTLKNLYAKK